jgi:hypothetical protein
MHRFELLATCAILSMVLIGCSRTDRVDMSEICVTIRAGAGAKFTQDAFGTQYLASKPWHVYTSFIANRQLRETLLHYLKGKDSSSITSWHGGSFRLAENSSGEVIAVSQIDSTYRIENQYYLVRMLVPVFDTVRDEYVTCVWLKDHNWTSGFQVFVRFKVSSGKGILVSADYLVIADIDEDH